MRRYGELVIQDVLERQRIEFRCASTNRRDGVRSKTEITSRMNRTGCDLATSKLPSLPFRTTNSQSGYRRIPTSFPTDPGFACTTNLVQSLFPAYHQRPLHFEQLEHFRKSVSELLLGYSQHHSLRSSRVDQGPEHVEDGPEVELPTDRSEMGKRRMVMRGEQEEERRSSHEFGKSRRRVGERSA